MPAPSLSEAKRRALCEIEAGRVIYDYMEQRYRSTAWPPAVKAPSIESVIEMGLATKLLADERVIISPRGLALLHPTSTQ